MTNIINTSWDFNRIASKRFASPRVDVGPTASKDETSGNKRIPKNILNRSQLLDECNLFDFHDIPDPQDAGHVVIARC